MVWSLSLRLLFLVKRSPQQRDLIARPYGRFFHLPVALAILGHEVKVQLCSQKGLQSAHIERDGIDWVSHDLVMLGPRGLWKALQRETAAFQPDWIIGCSDTWCGWIAHRLANKVGARLCIDAYDNYEAYMQWNKPLHWLWRRAINAAELVTAAGPQLASLLQTRRTHGHVVEIISMAADPEFVELDKTDCRQRMGLPIEATLIGYVGSWAPNRGTDMLLSAFRRLKAIRPDIKLVLSGHPPAHVLMEPGVIATGYVSDDKLPILINTLNIACVITANTEFGRYSYPSKLCEAMACNVPVLATDTQPVRWMLEDRGEHLVPVGDVEAFVEHAFHLLAKSRSGYGKRRTWEMQAQRFDQLLRSLSDQNR